MLDLPVTQPDRMVKLVEGILTKGSRTRPISVHDQLADVGLTSIDMVSLMLAVEAEFDVSIPPSDITPENFRSIASIGTMLSRLTGRA
ncbi:MAG: acyl carrier protein [Methylobacteriaceae bacterium]|nr:acyl carrier protein [Methylobacteriaceae bacterium]